MQTNSVSKTQWGNICTWGKSDLIYCTTFTDIAVVIQGRPCNLRDPVDFHFLMLSMSTCEKTSCATTPGIQWSMKQYIGLLSVFSSELVEDNRRVLADQYMNSEQESHNSYTRNCTIKRLLWNKFTSLIINGFSNKYWTYSCKWKLLWNQIMSAVSTVRVMSSKYCSKKLLKQ